MSQNNSKSEDYDGITVKRSMFYKGRAAKAGHAFFILSHNGLKGDGLQCKEFCSAGLTDEQEE